MAERDYKSIYQTWLRKVDDVDLSKELKGRNEAQIEDAFYRDLEFVTGGLRGVIGAGTNRRNIYPQKKQAVRRNSLLIYWRMINRFRVNQRKSAFRWFYRREGYRCP